MKTARLFTLLILASLFVFGAGGVVNHSRSSARQDSGFTLEQILSSPFPSDLIAAPTGDRVYELAVQPAMAGQVDVSEAFTRAAPPLRDFMLKQTREKDLALFVELSKSPRPQTPQDLSMRVVIPAYVISELKTGFQMGFFLFVPFLLIDLIVSTTLLSMGMLQLPPAMISLPFKILLFVMIDGWNLLVASLVRSFM